MKKLITVAALLIAVLCAVSACKNEKEALTLETEKTAGQASEKEKAKEDFPQQSSAKNEEKIPALKKEEATKEEAKAEASKPSDEPVLSQPSDENRAAVESLAAEFAKKVFIGDSSALNYAEAGGEAYLNAKEIISSVDSVRTKLNDISTKFAENGLDAQTVESISQKAQQWYSRVSQMAEVQNTDSQIADDEATVNITLSVPDFSLMNDFMSDENMNDTVAEIYSDDYFANLSSLSEDEQLAEFSRMTVKVFDRMFEKAAENIENNKKQEAMTLKIKKIGSNWVII